MGGESGLPKGQPASDRVQTLIIVGRDQADLWCYLTRHFHEFKRVQVLLDRRQGDRRRHVQPHEPERRRVERRWPLTSETDLRCRPFMVVLPDSTTLQS
jgi:hypothetical protein